MIQASNSINNVMLRIKKKPRWTSVGPDFVAMHRGLRRALTPCENYNHTVLLIFQERWIKLAGETVVASHRLGCAK